VSKTLRSWQDNPVLVKEFRTRMRGGKAYGVLLSYTLLLTLFIAIAYLQWVTSLQASGGTFTARAGFEAGQVFYRTLFVAQALMIALITPAITAGAITLEREQRTYEMVALTLLRPRDIIAGKLAAATAFVALLLTSSLPLVSLSFLLGGVSPGELFFTYLALAVSALLFGAIGIFWSAAIRSTAAATVITYGTVFGFFLVTYVVSMFPAWAGPNSGESPFRSLNVIGAVFNSVGAEIFFRTHLPSWLTAVTLNLLLALLMANLAMSRLEHFADAHPVPIRMLATALWVLFLLALFGNVMGRPSTALFSAQDAAQLVVLLTLISLALLLFVLPLFATGEVAGSPLAYLRGMLPHHVLAGDLPAGVPLLALWLLVPFLLVAAGFVLMDHVGFLPMTGALLPLAVVSFAAVAGFTAVGHFYSVLLPSRWAAMAMTYLTITSLTLLPYLSLIGWYDSGTGPAQPRLVTQLLYLVPFMAFQEQSWPSSFWRTAPQMWLGQTPFWIVTTVVYTVLTFTLGTATLALLGARHRRQK
jgi:ABC-type transport system involved in multi-copper enzyme maturation permease subunit